MTNEQYCRETAAACGYDLSDAEWMERGGANYHQQGPHLWLPYEVVEWRPGDDLEQALEVASYMGAELSFNGLHGGYVFCSAEEPGDQCEIRKSKADHNNDTSATVCAAIKGCWEVGHE